MAYELVVIGDLAGGIEACKELLENFNNPKGLPFIILQHISPPPNYHIMVEKDHSFTLTTEEGVAFASRMSESALKAVKPDFVGMIKENKKHLQALLIGQS